MFRMFSESRMKINDLRTADVALTHNVIIAVVSPAGRLNGSVMSLVMRGKLSQYK